ncbi:MAG: hypothetical protein ABW168_26620 [Sedimenticola sp.]
MLRFSPTPLLPASIRQLPAQTWIAYGVASLFLFLGCVVSLRTNDWNWFTRSGSLVVIVGLILTSQQIYEHLEYLAYRPPLKRGVGSGRSNHDWAQGSDKRRLLDRRYSNEVIWQKEAHGFYLLIIGTAVWGLGDLIGIYLL